MTAYAALGLDERRMAVGPVEAPASEHPNALALALNNPS
jgi:hypothetical protein